MEKKTFAVPRATEEELDKIRAVISAAKEEIGLEAYYAKLVTVIEAENNPVTFRKEDGYKHAKISVLYKGRVEGAIYQTSQASRSRFRYVPVDGGTNMESTNLKLLKERVKRVVTDTEQLV